MVPELPPSSDMDRMAADAIFGAAADAIVATDRDGLIRVWNPGAVRMFGHAAQDVLGCSLDVIIPERLRERHWQGFRITVDTGESRYGEGELLSVPALRKGGKQISVEFTIVPLKDRSGNMIGMAALMRDVTTRFQEMKRLRNAAKREALA